MGTYRKITWMPRRTLPNIARSEDGQAVILVALAIVVLLGALALGSEWGFALTQRRLEQNAADAGALASARLLASSVRNTNQGPMFIVTERAAYCKAQEFAAQNLLAFRPSSPVDTLVVEWAAANVSGGPLLPWQALSTPGAGGCPDTTGPLVNQTARFIRATPTVTYSSPIAAIAGKPSITASARAVARIVGTPIPADAPSWPMVRHYHAADFVSLCGPTPPCDPQTIAPFTFWSANANEVDFGQFKGLVDFSRYSLNANISNGRPACGNSSSLACVPQLIADWDHSGVSPGKPDLVSVFSGGTPCTPPAGAGLWLTQGLEDVNNADKQCSLLNWIGYGFGGSAPPGSTGAGGALSLDDDHSGIVWNGVTEFREAPTLLPNAAQRSVCASVPSVLKAPSCAARTKGDWVEAAATGNLGNGPADALRYFIDQHGATDGLSSTPTGPGAGAPLYGKKVVILVYLWDCAESFSQTVTGNNQWSIINPRAGGNDCSDIHDGNDIGSAQLGRVHLFTAAPFTFYRGLVSGSEIKGFWGGLVTGDPGICAANPLLPQCQLNAFSNAVFLVADD